MFTQTVTGIVPPHEIQRKFHYPIAATAAVITLAAPTVNARWIVSAIQWSYSDTPSGGRLTVTDDGVTIFDVSITAGGPGGFGLVLPGTINKAVVITLASGAGAIVGKLNAQVFLSRV